MSMENDIEKSVEKGIRKGIVKAVEDLICNGVVEDVTQRAINVIGANTVRAIDFGLAFEKFLQLVTRNEAECLQNIIVETLKSKNCDLDEDSLRKKLSAIKDLKKLKFLASEVFKCESEEAFIDSLDRQIQN